LIVVAEAEPGTETVAAVGLAAGALVVAPPVAGVDEVVVVPGAVFDLHETITNRIEASIRNCNNLLFVNFKVVLLLRRSAEC
jgi:hypothetical protein